MISVSEAKTIIARSVNNGKIKELPLPEAFGFTLAKDVIAAIDIPNFNQSSMDGYAIKYADKERALTIVGEMAAGTSRHLSIIDGEATRIFTGGPLPDGADTVVMQENVVAKGNKLVIDKDINLVKGHNVRPKGAEVKGGMLGMQTGTYLSAAAVGYLAGIGCTHVSVFAPPVTTIIITGNELQEPGRPLEFGQVYEANSVLLTSALNKAGIRDISVFRVEDNPAKVVQALQQALQQSDVVLLSGGVSVGDYDFVVSAAKECGVVQKFHKIKQKPGKPLYFGTLHEKLVFGLPGNPSSGLTCFYEYVLPAVEAQMHKDNAVLVSTATVTHNYSKPSGLTHFLKAYCSNNSVTPLHAQESFRLQSFAQANCFIILPEESTGCMAGDTVDVHLLPL